jgi:hypothetical protein
MNTKLIILIVALYFSGFAFIVIPLVEAKMQVWPDFFQNPTLFRETLTNYLTAQFIGLFVGALCMISAKALS